MPLVVQKLQVAVGETLTADLESMCVALVHAMADIPEPRTAVERLLLSALLLKFADRVTYRAHALTHGALDPACPFREHAFAFRLSTSDDDPLLMFRRWLPMFIEALRLAHPLSSARRAAAILATEYRRPLNILSLARRVQSSPRQLQRAFRRELGMTIRDCQTRERVLASLETVIDAKSESTALDVGYRSRKNFYRSFRKLTGLTPTQFRTLPGNRRQEIVSRVRRPLQDHSTR